MSRARQCSLGLLGAWRRSEIERTLAGLAGVTVYHDRHSAEARRFQVATAEYVLLYDREGRLTFTGGITAARGDAGENHGRLAVIEPVINQAGHRAQAPVFGCSLSTLRTADEQEPRP